MEETQQPLPPEDLVKWDLAFSILRDAVRDAGIPEYKGEPLNLRWHVFAKYEPHDVILTMHLTGTIGIIWADYSLLWAARYLIDETAEFIQQPNMNKLLDIESSDYPEVIRETTYRVLKDMIDYVPRLLFHLLNQAMDDTIGRHLKTYVEPLLKEHWQEIGMPKGFTLAPPQAMKKLDKQFDTLRQSYLGNNRALLTPEKFANLREEHQSLRLEYQAAKKYYEQSQEIFFNGRRNATMDEWKDEWRTRFVPMFPQLHYQCLYDIQDFQPAELAHSHLAERYGLSAAYMKKLIYQLPKPAKPKAE